MRPGLIPNSTNSLEQPSPWRRRRWLAILAALSLLTLLVHGYHPFAEDGGLYVAGVQYTLNPSLFPHYTAFVTEHLRFSLFAPVLAGIVHFTHLPLDWVLLLIDLCSIFLTLTAAQQILRRCIPTEVAQFAGVGLLVAWWTLPIAGTSLLLMDPYVTARSLSTPLSLLAIAFALDSLCLRSTLQSTLCLMLAALFHPLMAGYGFAVVLAIHASRLRRRKLVAALLVLLALAFAATLQANAAHESPTVVAAALSRYYWFLSQWQWFELLGLAGPLAILIGLLLWQDKNLNEASRTLIRASLFTGCVAILIALLFAHEGYAAHIVARLQPLRIFLPIYAIMVLLLGATLTQAFLQRARPRTMKIILPTTILLSLCAVMFFVQRVTFPASPHIEFPNLESRNQNPWVRAFLWARDNTPPDALFALDARYVNEDGEDAQTFRAWSLRSALPDFSKDGGEASITPTLADPWQRAAAAQQGLSTDTDKLRNIRIGPLGATWMVVHSTAQTAHPCPYDNGTIKVCRLDP
jgi:hypothetical protein